MCRAKVKTLQIFVSAKARLSAYLDKSDVEVYLFSVHFCVISMIIRKIFTYKIFCNFFS